MPRSVSGADIDNNQVVFAFKPLILWSWRYIFNLEFFGGRMEEEPWLIPSHQDCLEALPIIAAFARRRGDDKEEALIMLVEQVCNKLDEEKQFRQQRDVRRIQEQTSVESSNICDLGKQIRGLLDFEGSV